MTGYYIFSDEIVIESPSEGGRNRAWVKIAPATGTVKKNGREFTFSRDLNRAIQKTHHALLAAGFPPPIIDYEHYSADATKTPAQRVMAGEVIGEYDEREDGLYAEIEFTPPAWAHLENREYRRVSPELHLQYKNPKTGSVMGPYIPAIALTTRPFLPNLGEINFSQTDDEPFIEEHTDMNSAKIAELLGLKADASEDSIVGGIKELIAKAQESTEKMAEFSAQIETFSADLEAAKTENADLKMEQELKTHEEYLAGLVGKKITTATAKEFFSNVQALESNDEKISKIAAQKDVLDALPENDMIPKTNGKVQTFHNEPGTPSAIEDFFNAITEEDNFSEKTIQAIAQFGNEAVEAYFDSLDTKTGEGAAATASV